MLFVKEIILYVIYRNGNNTKRRCMKMAKNKDEKKKKQNKQNKPETGNPKLDGPNFPAT
ncbi:phage portal protein [Bacillus cereus]|uniref:Phage portal protein n=2 Tax=Bacillus cereus group TaxID=86661 RepID=A0A2C1Y1I3_BACCE|nr:MULTISPECIES: phage portal protein [Bacillus cereus group]OUA08093.1 phage portal protein [Bacillus thuringiensis serovar finitimus]PEC87258.1 phage portal protein [Bacillus cereus]PEQ50795.1 phage portal protein [Bacillus cereus]PEX39274.1 phage portal protein [Bacillus cereus]PFB16780.1 phage portal protein [Bacillus cereus]